MRRRLLNGIDKSIKLMDVLFYDKIVNQLFITQNTTDLMLKRFRSERYEPIGIVVIPTAHDVYGTGECGVMALMSASLSTPDTGQVGNDNMMIGSRGESGPINFNTIPVLKIENNIIQNFIEGAKSSGYMPIMNMSVSTGQICQHDPKSKYVNVNLGSSYGYIPSPYLKDESRNSTYYQTDPPASESNALSDFNGLINTTNMCSKAISQPDWKTDITINNSSTTGYYPAACACWRYHTTGTSYGDWYLPACGELGYIFPRYDLIELTLTFIQTIFNRNICALSDSPQLSPNTYLTSTYSSFNTIRSIVVPNGRVEPIFVSSPVHVRPFMKGVYPIKTQP